VNWGEVEPSDDVDFSDARLLRAIEETKALVGHAVEFRFNVAMMPRPKALFFERLFAHEVGGIPRELARLREADAAVYSYGSKHLRAVHFDYDGSRRRTDVQLDTSRGVLHLRLGGWGSVPRPALSRAFLDSYRADLTARFEGRKGSEIADQSRREYTRYLKNVAFRGERPQRARALAHGVDLWRATRGDDAEIHAELTSWLVSNVHFFTNQYRHHQRELNDAPPDAPWHEAERAFGRFVTQGWPAFSPGQKRDLLEEMYVRQPARRGRGQLPYRQDVFPGVDLFAHSLAVVDEWRKAGHPAPQRTTSEDHAQRLYDFIVCPPRRTTRHEYNEGRCSGDFYRYSVADPELRAKLFAEVLRRDDANLTDALFANLLFLESPYATDGWRFMERDPGQWAAATKVFAELLDYSRQELRPTLLDDATRLWRERPAFRGGLLYLFAAMDHHRGTQTVPWDRFKRVFGSLASGSDFEAFLRFGETAVVRASVVWPALAREGGAVGSLIPHLERAMDDGTIRQRFHRFPYEPLRSLIHAIRSEGGTEGLARLRGFFERRMRKHPSEARLFRTLARMAKPGGG
jgi:hypothetical protein